MSILWSAIGAVVAALTLLITVVRIVVKFSNNVTEQTAAVNNLSEKLTGLSTQLTELTTKNSETHKDLYSQVNDHEKRIVVLEDHDNKKR